MQTLGDRGPALFRHGMSPGRQCLLGLALSASLLLFDGNSQYSALLRGLLERGMAPLMVALELPGEAARELARGLSSQGELLRQIARLEQENETLRVSLRDTRLLQTENDELRSLAGLATENFELWQTVEIIQRGRGIASQRFLIDAGAARGVRHGMALVHPEGVIGQVTAVSETTADVSLITDSGQNTPVEFVRTGLRGVLVGEGVPDRASLGFIASNADVEPGDRLVTSGLDGVYPRGMPVAEVVSVERKTTTNFARVMCRPAAGMDGRRHFMVVIPRAPATGEPEADSAVSGETKVTAP